MSILGFRRYALLSCATAAMLAGCGGSQSPGAMPRSALATRAERGTSWMLRGGLQPPTGAPSATSRNAASSPSYRVLHRFNRNDESAGARPLSGLINVDGTLYGTTFGRGNGTVFSISTTGKHRTLHRFNGRDGSSPWDAPLVAMNGTLFGTTYYDSVVFSVGINGGSKVIHHFTGKADGLEPWAGLTDVSGTLYGTTSEGGGGICSEGCGTVFSISASGAENVVYRFSGEPDGETPGAALLDVNGTLYGTTANGGEYGNGCVYSITASGAENVLYSFGRKPDGNYPIAPLIDVKGTLYGTTLFGGTSEDGTVFSVSTTGKEKVLYSFTGGFDGEGPDAALLNVHGTLYGMTGFGGSSSCSASGYYGCGTVYSVTTSGVEKVLYAFEGGTDGAQPQANLVDVKGTLFGTTVYGGGRECDGIGCGTVFEIKP
jgi:uncharacterized repeat protein (TIGR03803 family)